MSRWTREQLERVAASDDFHIAPYRDDGRTPGTSIWVWAVPVDDVVFVRTENPASRWFAAAIRQRAGHATLNGRTAPVSFDHVTDDALIDRIDAAFTAKYADDSYFSVALLQGSRTRIVGLVPMSAFP
ncbi:DUF2255 family protein [Labedella populi]|uniref:DUF2255 family protein n=1 Tax=Labedella populi TaxID=2498850 RepID=A0A444Q3V4_9MICO|nr:DUF2255 family protein [Labedella populi]RWZ58444.1 DUF2255 family protein [Labedella populi]